MGGGGGGERDIVNSLRPAREGGGVVRGHSEFIFSRPSPHTHTSTFTAAENSVGWVGKGALPTPLPIPLPYLHSCSKSHAHKYHNNQYRKQKTEYRVQNLMYIKLPMYMFYYWCLDIMILMREHPLLVPLEGGGP